MPSRTRSLSQTREEYWAAFEEFLQQNRHDLEIQRWGSQKHFRWSPVEGVDKNHAHFAAVASLTNSGIRRAGNRVQLVLQKPHASHYLDELSRHGATIDSAIPGAQWLEKPVGDASHIEVWKEHRVGQRDEWTEDFAWMLGYLLIFRRVLSHFVQEASTRL
ncbi:MAG: DUF4268 domain-containing protein [Chloroflexi bacterium]|nr:DUF4268 domain-containing protein [Chloroflexota bacterium]